MSDHRETSPALPEVRFASQSATPLTVFDASTPLPIRPEMLTEGLRQLQQRIPGYVHFSADETRSRMRMAYFSPEFIENGIITAIHWPEAKAAIGASGEELREQQEEIARWDEAIKEFRVMLEGLEGANLERKYRLGESISVLYNILKKMIDTPEKRHLRPYLEAMAEAYRKGRKKPGPAAKGSEGAV